MSSHSEGEKIDDATNGVATTKTYPYLPPRLSEDKYQASVPPFDSSAVGTLHILSFQSFHDPIIGRNTEYSARFVTHE